MSQWAPMRWLARTPPLVLALMGLYFVTMLLAASQPPLRAVADQSLLVPDLVFRGEVWRLATWMIMEEDSLSSLAVMLALGVFGRDLVPAWGAAWSVAVFLSVGIAAAVFTCLVATVWPVMHDIVLWGG